jgi:hypothetical protein
VGVTDARKQYDALTDDLLYDPAVGRSTMMGYPCVRRAGRFFASFDIRADTLVAKLPRERVAELIASGVGEPFAPNGRVFREWVTVRPLDSEVWQDVLAEALEFAAAEKRAAGAFDEDLANRIREVLSELDVKGVREQRMFGGLAFLVGGHIAIAASREGGVLLNVDPDETASLLTKAHTLPMVMRGRELAGWVRVDPEGVRTKRQLNAWVTRGVDRARSRPPK